MASITIGNNKINFPKETTIDHIEVFKHVICFSTWRLEADLDWKKIETHQIWKERCLNNPSELFCYDSDGILKWKFPFDGVCGIHAITLEPFYENGIMFDKHLAKYKGKELLEVYAGNFRYVVDVNTGEIYSKMESR